MIEKFCNAPFVLCSRLTLMESHKHCHFSCVILNTILGLFPIFFRNPSQKCQTRLEWELIFTVWQMPLGIQRLWSNRKMIKKWSFLHFSEGHRLSLDLARFIERLSARQSIGFHIHSCRLPSRSLRQSDSISSKKVRERALLYKRNKVKVKVSDRKKRVLYVCWCSKSCKF